MRIPGLTLDAADPGLDWRSTRQPGVSWILLSPEGVFENRGAAVLIRMEAGSGYAPHRHLQGEEVLVLQGGYRDELGEHRAGDFVAYPPGSSHAPVALGQAGDPACVLFAVARGGIEPLAEGEAGVPEGRRDG